MPVEVTVPELGESITEGTIVAWLVEVGEAVEEDQPLLELETDKVTAELPAPIAGVITEQLFEAGADVNVGAVVARIDGSAAPKAAAAPAASPSPKTAPQSPAVRRLLDEHDLDAGDIPATGKDGRLLKGDVLAYLAAQQQPDMGPGPAAAAPDVAPDLDLNSTIAGMQTLATELRSTKTSIKPLPPTAPKPAAPAARSKAPAPRPTAGGRAQRRVRMTRMRRAIATRLKEVQNTAAILTTFNEVDMKPVMDMRGRYKEQFQKRHGTIA